MSQTPPTPPQGPPPGWPPQGMPPQGMPPQGMPPQGMPPQGMPPQGMPPQGMPPQGMPPQGMPAPAGAPVPGSLPGAAPQLPPPQMPAQPPPQAQPPAPQAAAHGQYHCPYCGTTSVDPGLSCPSCGSPVSGQLEVTDSGWIELPGVRDMARIQFGGSDCQISGNIVPVADMNLAAGDGVYFPHHVLLWREPQVVVTQMQLAGGFKRMLAGLPVFMTQAKGPGHIAFSRDVPGETVAIHVQPGRSIDVREHHMLVASASASYSWFASYIWFQTQQGNDSETHYPLGQFMDRFQSEGQPGLVLLHASGNVFTRDLAPGQTILVKPTALLYKDSSVNMHLHIEHPAGGPLSFWRQVYQRYIWVRLIGPGRVAIESAFEPVEDTGNFLSGTSGGTQANW